MENGHTLQRLMGALLTAGLLAGCSPPLWSRTERHLACPCPPAQAVAYVTQAALALNVTPVFSAPDRLHMVRPNPDGLTVTKLDVAITLTQASTSEVQIRTETPATESAQDKQVAEAFAAAFAAAAKEGQPPVR
jgi:hypothetical protein